MLIAASSSTDFVMIGGAPFFQSYSRIAEKVLRAMAAASWDGHQSTGRTLQDDGNKNGEIAASGSSGNTQVVGVFGMRGFALVAGQSAATIRDILLSKLKAVLFFDGVFVVSFDAVFFCPVVTILHIVMFVASSF